MSDEFLRIALPIMRASSGIIVVASFTPPFPSREWSICLAGSADGALERNAIAGGFAREPIFLGVMRRLIST